MALAQIANLRKQAAVLARGGEYSATGDVLADLVATSLAASLPADALLRARQAVELALLEGESAASARALVDLAVVLLAVDDGDAAISAAQLSIEHASHAPEHPTARRSDASAKLAIGTAHRRAERFDDARAALTAARAAAVAIAASDIAAAALVELWWLDLHVGQPRNAAVCFDFARRFFDQAGRAIWAARVTEWLVAALLEAGDLGDAIDAADEADVRAAALPDAIARARVAGALADALLEAGHDDAEPWVNRAAELATEMPDSIERSVMLIIAHLRRARVLVDASEVARHLEAATDLAFVSRTPRHLQQLILGLLMPWRSATAALPAQLLQRLLPRLRDLGHPELAAMVEAGLSAVP